MNWCNRKVSLHEHWRFCKFLIIVVMGIGVLFLSSQSTHSLPNFSQRKTQNQEKLLNIATQKPYFKILKKKVYSPVFFHLYSIYSNTNINSKSNFLENAFRLDFSINSNTTTARYYHEFTYDELMRIRDITKIDKLGRILLAISLNEEGNLVLITESIPKQLKMNIVFNRNSQIAIKTITAKKQNWQYRYQYRNGRISRLVSLNNGKVVNDQTIVSRAGLEGQEISRIDQFDSSGEKTHYWEIKKDISIRFGQGREILRSYTPYSKLKEEIFRIWTDNKIIEEYLFRDNTYYRILYQYDNNGLLKEKKVIDNTGKNIVVHHYQYNLPDNLQELVFLEQLKLNIMKKSYYWIGGRMLIERHKMFTLQTLVSSYQEEISKNDKTVAHHSYTGGLDTVTIETPDTLEKKIINPQSGITLSTKKIIYDSYQRISKITFTYPNGANTSTHFFYKDRPPALAIAKSNDFFIKFKNFYLGHIFLRYIKKRQLEIKNINTSQLRLEEQFKKFTNHKDYLIKDNSLLSQLRVLRSSQLRKIIVYNDKRQVAYYYRIKQKEYSPQVMETQFTFYRSPPKLSLRNNRLKTLMDNQNSYFFTGNQNIFVALSNSYYSYLSDGGEFEFYNQATDNLKQPNKSYLFTTITEKPLETIVIRYTKDAILMNAKQILYNRFSGLPEVETHIMGAKTIVKKFN